MDCWMYYESPDLGRLTLAADENGLVGLWMEGQKYFGAGLSPEAEENAAHPALLQAADWLGRYFAGERPCPGSLPLAPRGTDFQQRVWAGLLGIGYGRTVTYGALARELGMPAAVRAVAGAVGRNPISILIPCHRVVGADGRLTGYAGGLERKRFLLELEKNTQK